MAGVQQRTFSVSEGKSRLKMGENVASALLNKKQSHLFLIASLHQGIKARLPKFCTSLKI